MSATFDGRLEIHVSLDSPPVSQAGFGVAMLASMDVTFPERIRYYESAQAAESDAALLGPDALALVRDAFAQDPTPSRLAVGRIGPFQKQVSEISFNAVAQVHKISVLDTDESNTYTITLNGSGPSVVTTGYGEDESDVATAIANAINGFMEDATAVSFGSVVTITSDNAGQPFALSVLASVPTDIESSTEQPSVPAHGDQLLARVNGREAAVVTHSVGDKISDLVGALKVAIDALGEPVTTADMGSTLTVTASDAGESFALEVAATNPASVDVSEIVPSAGVYEGLAAVLGASSDWYGFSLDMDDREANQEAIKFANANKRLFGGITTDPNALVLGDTDNGLSDFASSDNAFCVYIDQPEHVAFNLLVNRLGFGPDTHATIWSYVRLQNTTQASINDTEKAAIKEKNGNVYLSFFGVPASGWGTVGSGLKIDLIVLKHWLEARIPEAVAQKLLDFSGRGQKVPYSPVGFAMVRAWVQEVLSNAEAIGHLIAGTSGVILPDFNAVPEADRRNRLLRFQFGGQPSGAIEDARMQGFVTIDFTAA